MPSLCSNEVDDIEDLTLSTENIPVERRSKLTVRARKLSDNGLNEDNFPSGDSIIPGTQKIWVKTWGCAHNNSDGEYMAGQLASYGYKLVDDKLCADLWLLNSCTVKGPAEDHFRNEVNKGRDLGKYVVVAGCVPQGQPRAEYIQGLSVVGVQQIDRVVEVVEETLKGHSVRLLGQKKRDGKKIGGASLMLPKVRKNPLIEIIAINTGCLNQCTYCKTKHARGELGSYPIEEIVERAKQSFQEGVVEIWLTSEDTGAYGRDIGVTLPELLWRLVETIPSGAMLRLGMTNPPYILEHLEEMAKILNHPSVYLFLHIPVQSGSDAILADMKREYGISDFRHVVDYLRERVPDLTIATDVICGFPTETEEDFMETYRLVEDYKFPSLFINQFFPRIGTPAARMRRLPSDQVKKRTKIISDLFRSYQTYDNKVGRVEKVLVTEVSHDQAYYVAHNKSYDQILVAKDENLLGKMVEVVMTSAGKHFLIGELVKGGVITRPVNVPKCLEKGVISGLGTSSIVEAGKEREIVTGRRSFWLPLSVAIVGLALVSRLALFAFSQNKQITSFSN